MWLSVLGIFVALTLFVVGVMVSLTYSERVGDMDVERGVLIMRIAAGVAVVSVVWGLGKLLGVV